MIETGINISLTENVSGPAQQVSKELGDVANSADGISKALDPDVLEGYLSKLNEIGQKYSEIQTKAQRERQRQKEEENAARQRDQAEANAARQRQNEQLQAAQQVQASIQATGAASVQAGRGDIVGAGMSGLRGLGGLLTGTAGIAVGAGIAGLAAAHGMATTYGEAAAVATPMAAMTGRLGTDLEANNQILLEEIGRTTDAVRRYGRTFEEGVAARTAFMRAGGTGTEGLSDAALYSLTYGEDLGSLAAFTGQAERYGQSDALNAVRAVKRGQGLSDAQFGEMLGGVQQIFTQGLSAGLVRPMEDIARQLEFFGRGDDPLWQGGLGAQRVSRMNQAVAGAANLQNQSDLFLYRAAAAGGGSYLDIRERMEQGLNPEMFQNLMGEFERFGYGETESVMQLSRMFGLSTTAARSLYSRRGQDITSAQVEATLGGELSQDMGRTTATIDVETSEDMRDALRGATEAVHEFEQSVKRGTAATIDFLAGPERSSGDAIVRKIISGENISSSSDIHSVMERLSWELMGQYADADIDPVEAVQRRATLTAAQSRVSADAVITGSEMQELLSLVQELIQAVNSDYTVNVEQVFGDI
jgi:hypothetical protein